MTRRSKLRSLVGRDRELEVLSELLESDRSRGVLLRGVAGVGKSRLAGEFAARARLRGWGAEYVVGLPGAEVLPLAPFAHLVTEGAVAPQDSAERLVQFSALLMQRQGPAGMLLAVDDLYRLDLASALLVRHVLERTSCRVLLVNRSEEAVPGDLAGLVEDPQAVATTTLDPLDLDACGTLVEEILGGRVGAELQERVWDLTLGNPLFVRELLSAGIAAGSIRRSPSGEWTGDSFGTTPVLDDLVAARLDGVGDVAGTVVDAIAVSEPLPLEVAERLVSIDVLAQLEETGLIGAHADGEREMLRFGHPLYGEVARARTPRLKLRLACRNVADAFESCGLYASRDVVEYARLRLEAGESDSRAFQAAADVCISALDGVGAERFAKAAADGGGFEAALALTTAQSLQGRETEAEQGFRDLIDTANDHRQRISAVLALAQHYMYKSGDVTAALDLLAEHEGLAPKEADPLRALRALVLFFSGNLPAAAEAGAPLMEKPALSAGIVSGAQGAASALAVMGHAQRVLDHSEARLLELSNQDPPFEYGPYVGVSHLTWNRLLALWQLGRIHEGDDPYLPLRHKWEKVPLSPVEPLGMMSAQACLRGHLDRAAAGYDELGDLWWTLALPHATFNFTLRAAVEAQRGNPALAREHLGAVEDKPLQHLVGFLWWVERSHVLVRVADGDIHGGVGACLVLAERFESQWLHAGISLHDVVRFGRADLVADWMQDRAARPDATWWDRVSAEHAAAAATCDGTALVAVARRFAGGGLDLYAAEAAAQAATLMTDAGDRVGAAAASELCRRYMTLCGRARTPALSGTPPSLTVREFEVAHLAATGLTNPEIASRLGTSVRTVANQLQSVYGKLGVHSRDDLGRVLDVGHPPVGDTST